MPHHLHTILLSAALLTSTLATAQTTQYVTAATASKPAFTPAPAQATEAQPSAEHAAAVRRMLNAMSMPAMLRYSLIHPSKTVTPEQMQLLQHMHSHVSDDDIMRVVTPVYAKYISQHAADFLSDYYRSGIGRRGVNAELAKLGLTDGNKQALYTPAEIVQLKRFASTPEAHELTDASSKIQADMYQASVQWGAQYFLHLMGESTHSVMQQMNAVAARKDGEPAIVVTVPRTGLAILDQMALAMADNSLAIEQADRKFKKDSAHSGVDSLLLPARLTSQEELTHSREAMRQLDAALENYLQALSQQQEKYRQRLLGISSEKQVIAGFERGLARAFDWQLRFAENQRGMIDLYNRILTFAESRQGQVSVENDKLLFKTDDDLQLYRSLLAQLRQSGDEENQLQKERLQSGQQALKQSN